MNTPAIRDYLRVAAVGGDVSDAALLERFAAARDEAAFELLVWRHAALVQRVCKGVLRDHHAAEDAAQATFLVLALKARTVRGSVVGWLYRVARRVAVRLAKQRARSPVTAELDRLPAALAESAAPDELAAVCDEVAALPERYRVPVLLCFFEGLTHAEAARRIGWPVGTVAGRLARAKDILARRLSRKGVGVAAVVLGVPAGSFVGATAHAAAAFAARTAVVPGIAQSVHSLAEGACRAMSLTVTKAAALAAGLFLATATVWGVSQTGAGAPQQPPAGTGGEGSPSPAKPAAAVPVAGASTADAKQRARSQHNLKQIMIAVHAYQDVYGNLPHNITVGLGKPVLSWRVAILQFLEQENLYKKFKLDEPWDSDHNKKLLAEMPDVYRVGFEAKGETKTYYQGFAGKGSAFEPGAKLGVGHIEDGMSNTLGVVEAGPPVEWTKPADLVYDPAQAVRRDGPFKNVMMAALLDGTVQSFRPDLDDKAMHLLIARDDGQQVPPLNTLKAQLPFTPEDLKSAQDLLKANEKLLELIAEQRTEQQKLLVEMVKMRNANAQGQGIDLDRLNEIQRSLANSLRLLKRDTDAMRKDLNALGKK